MKITIKNDGALIIDGENSTVIYGESDTGINCKIQGNNTHFYTDFIKIEGDEPNMNHEIYNFCFISTEGKHYFGEDIKIGSKTYKYIGIDKTKERKPLMLWDTENEVMLLTQ